MLEMFLQNHIYPKKINRFLSVQVNYSLLKFLIVEGHTQKQKQT